MPPWAHIDIHPSGGDGGIKVDQRPPGNLTGKLWGGLKTGDPTAKPGSSAVRSNDDVDPQIGAWCDRSLKCKPHTSACRRAVDSRQQIRAMKQAHLAPLIGQNGHAIAAQTI